MLSWSAEATETTVDLRAVTDPGVDPLRPGGRELLAYTDAVLAGGGRAAAATAVEERLGRNGLVAAAGVIGNFQMMNRIADGTGMPLGPGSRRRLAGIIETLGLDRFDHRDEPR
ncbi:MAG TPA: hypothetical protein VLL51_06245 [Gemmatimonadales bacterium]|nr:hypothetical protein [Gemmatimonadales bacterium]